MRTQQFHFFASNVFEWKTGTDLMEVLEWFATQKNHPFNVWYIPKPNGSAYEIKQYSPQARGAKHLGTYKGKKLIDY
jgi:hypothetical protein